MKNSILSKIVWSLLGVFLIATFVSTFADVGSSFVYAMASGAIVNEGLTVEKTMEESADLDKPDISKKIVMMKPAATPLDTILRNIGAGTKIDAFKTEYYAVDTKSLSDTVKTLYTSVGDGDVTTDLEVNNVHAWKADDTLHIPGVTGRDGLGLVCFVASVNISGGTIKIQAINGADGSGATAGKRIVPTIAADLRLVRMGPAKYETDAQTTPYSAVPTKEYNYCQLFMAQVEQSIYQRMHGKEVNWNFNDLEALNIYDMRATIEFSFLHGYRDLFLDEINQQDRYSVGGVERYITKALEYGTGGADRTIDTDTFIGWAKDIFTGNAGSTKRLLFAGNGLVKYLHGADIVSKQLDADKTEVVHGITFNKIVTNFGILLVYHHPLFDISGWNDNGMVLDINNIEKRVFQPMQLQTLDLVKAGTKKADATVISETSTLVLRYPDTHALIGPQA